MIMSEFETLLTRIDGLAAKVETLAVQFAAHTAAEAAVGKHRSRWADRLWTLAVCLAGGALGFWLRK